MFGEPTVDRAAYPARTPARKAGFSPCEGEIPRDADSPLEESGFEPSVPLFVFLKGAPGTTR